MKRKYGFKSILNRVGALALAVLLFVGTVPAMAFADEIPEGNEAGNTGGGDSIGVIELQPEENTITFESLPDEDVLLEQYIEHLAFGEAKENPDEAKAPKLRGAKRISLTENEREIYESLKVLLAEIADGNESNTQFSLELTSYFTDCGPSGEYTPEALGIDPLLVDKEDENNPGTYYKTFADGVSEALYEKADIDVSRIVSALRAECPYELYWFDKTAGMSYGLAEINTDGTNIFVDEARLEIEFTVSLDYRGANRYTTDTTKTSAASEMVSTAEAIVAEYSALDDIDRLEAYKNRICSLTDYNHGAANNNEPYGNPWQLIWVFDDEDPENPTNVVCEGYSKAFKLLCDLTNAQNGFESDIDCRIVTGIMYGATGEGRHMWNIVTIDGWNYLVDVTNCDIEGEEPTNYLFMIHDRDDEYNVESYSPYNYSVFINGTEINYQYDKETIGLYDASELRIDNFNPNEDMWKVTFEAEPYGYFGGEETSIIIYVSKGEGIDIDDFTPSVSEEYPYDFMYWEHEGERVTSPFTPDGDVTLTARYEKKLIPEVTERPDNAVQVPEDFNGWTYVQFTPEQSGLYKFESHYGGDPMVAIYSNEEKMYADRTSEECLVKNDDGGEENNFRLYCDLEAETTYYLAIFFYNKDGDELTLSISRVDEENTYGITIHAGDDGAYFNDNESLTTIVMPVEKEQYIGREPNVKNSNEGLAVIGYQNNDSETIDRADFVYRVPEGDEEWTIQWGTVHTVTFHRNLTDEDEAYPITVVSGKTIPQYPPDWEDPERLKVITSYSTSPDGGGTTYTLDEIKSLPIDEDYDFYAQWTSNEDIATVAFDARPYGYLGAEESIYYIYVKKGQSIDLDGYTPNVDIEGDRQYEFIYWKYNDSEAESPFTVEEDVTFEAYYESVPPQLVEEKDDNIVDVSRDYAYVQFTPTRSGLYKFESTYDGDPQAELYASEDEMYAGRGYLAINYDISWEDKNFRLYYDLEAGTTYYLRISPYDRYSNELQLSVSRIKEEDAFAITVHAGEGAYFNGDETKTEIVMLVEKGQPIGRAPNAMHSDEHYVVEKYYSDSEEFYHDYNFSDWVPKNDEEWTISWKRTHLVTFHRNMYEGDIEQKKLNILPEETLYDLPEWEDPDRLKAITAYKTSLDGEEVSYSLNELYYLSIDQDYDFYAQWSATKRITLYPGEEGCFDNGDGDRDSEPKSLTYPKGDTITISNLPEPVAINGEMAFDCWYYDAERTSKVVDDEIILNEDIPLYAGWTSEFNTITFDANMPGAYLFNKTGEWSGPMSILLADGKPIGNRAPAAEYEGEDKGFYGSWNTQSDGEGTSYSKEYLKTFVPDEDMYLYAEWEDLSEYYIQTTNCTADKGNARAGESVTFTVSPSVEFPDATLLKWYVNGTETAKEDDSNTLTIEMPAEDVEVVAYLEAWDDQTQDESIANIIGNLKVRDAIENVYAYDGTYTETYMLSVGYKDTPDGDNDLKSTVEDMIEEMRSYAGTIAVEYDEKGVTADSEEIRTWDNRKYETLYYDQDSLEMQDETVENGSVPALRLHRASGGYGKETTYTYLLEIEFPPTRNLYLGQSAGSIISIEALNLNETIQSGANVDVFTPYKGETVNLGAGADGCYEFVGWYKGVVDNGAVIDYYPDNLISSDANYSFTITEDTALYLLFEPHHDLSKTEAKAATCTEAGNIEYWTCGVCHKLFSDAGGTTQITLDDTIIPARHTPIKIKAEAATCTETGNIEHWKCSVCDKLFSDAEGTIETTLENVTIAALGHKLDKTEAKAATCTEAGNDEYWTCSVCHKLFSDKDGTTATTLEDVTIAALGHKLDKTESKAATCTEAGNDEYWTCSVCHKLYLEEEGTTETTLSDVTLAALGHKLDKTEAKAATCTEAGNDEYWTCSVCHKLFSDAEGTTETTLDDVTIAALGHKLSKVDAKEATCTETGNTEHWKCSVCNRLFSDKDGTTETTLDDVTIAAKGHKLDKTESKAATCTEAGNKGHWKCSVCDKLFSDAEGTTKTTLDDVTIAALGHAWDAGVVQKNPTYTEEGEKLHTCSVCGATKTEKIPVIAKKDISKATVTGLSNKTYTGKAITQTPVVKVGNTTLKAGTDYTVSFSNNVKVGTATVTITGKGNYTGTVKKTFKITRVAPELRRLFGEGRIDTALEIAGAYKGDTGQKKLNNVIVVNGKDTSFPDALSAGNISAKLKAPIILTDGTAKRNNQIVNWVKKNMNKNGGKVYFVGGTAVLPNLLKKQFNNAGYKVGRVAGDNRLDTNLAALEFAKIKSGSEVVVADGWEPYKALIAAGTGKPVLLVHNSKLTEKQKKFLRGKNFKFTVVDYKKETIKKISTELKSYGTVSKVTGTNLDNLSVNVAKRFWKTEPTEIFLARSAGTFADSLGGSAECIGLKGPLFLVSDKAYKETQKYVNALMGVKRVTVFGGSLAVSDKVAKAIAK